MVSEAAFIFLVVDSAEPIARRDEICLKIRMKIH